MPIVNALFTGLLAGLHTSTWGMYKDAPHEGFSWSKYARSTMLSAAIATLLAVLGVVPIAGAGDLLVLFGLTYALERACLEFYKTFLREEDQSKYFIPMQFHVRGQIVRSRAARAGAALAAICIALVFIAVLIALSPLSGALSRPLVFLLAGSLGGWYSAFGGAWKDAPIEGFETLKFFRSPLLSGGYALLLSHYTDHLAVAALGGLGFTVATLETYKTFCFPSKPRGKFAGKPYHYPQLLAWRQRFVPMFVSVWVAVVITFVVSW